MKSIGPIVKAIADMTGVKRQKLAESLGINAQSLTNKYSRDSFSAIDLIKIATACGCRLSFTDEKGKSIITFPELLQNEADEEQKSLD